MPAIETILPNQHSFNMLLLTTKQAHGKTDACHIHSSLPGKPSGPRYFHTCSYVSSTHSGASPFVTIASFQPRLKASCSHGMKHISPTV